MTTNTDTYVPTNEDAAAAQRVTSWRITNGMFRTGEGEEGTAQLANVIGLPTRIGLTEEYVTKEGKTIPVKVRMTVQQTDGSTFSFNVGYDSTQSRNLMGALTLWDGKSYLSITPNLSSKPNKHGKMTTYVNVKECFGPGQWRELRYDAGSADWGSLHEDLATELEDLLSIWKDWTYEEPTSGAAPWDAVSNYLEGLGFQRYTKQKPYDDLLEKAAKKPVSAFEESDWAAAPKWMSVAVQKNLIPDVLKADHNSSDDFDPFADE